MKAQPIIIKDWQDGVAPSPNLGFARMSNVDIESFPGAVRPQKQTASLFHTALAATFTADAGTDICTLAGTVPATGTAVVLTTTGTLPAGLTTSTTYFVINVSASTFKLATTLANANSSTAINITDAGTGTHTMTTRNPGTIKHIVKDQRSGVQFWQDSNGRVWVLESGATRLKLLDGNTLTNASGNGLVLFLNSDGSATYLFAFRNNEIDVVNVHATANRETPSWTNTWNFGGAVSDTTLNSGSGSSNSHHAILGQDNIIYFCDARYVGSIRENTGQVFDPSNTATYTGNDQALDTPQTEVTSWLEELGSDLLIAGGMSNFIYPWDRISSSYRLPLAVPEFSIKKIKNAGGLVYILAGGKGNIYSTQGTYVNFVKQIPQYLVNASASLGSELVTWGGIAMRNGALIMGVGGQTAGNSGVYMLYPDGRLLMDNMPSTGSANVTALYAENDYYFLGYASGGDYSLPTGDRYSNYQAVIQSPLYRVADKTMKASFSTIEIQLGTLGTGSVRLGWRGDRLSSFTTITEFTVDGSTTSYEYPCGLNNLENIQIQVELNAAVELLEVRLLP